jgi:hypothetical protein
MRARRPSEAERAADVNVPAGTQADEAQATDADGAGTGAAEQQGVRAEFGGKDGFIVH